MSESVEKFYDDLASNYHLMFEDWRQTVLEEGETIDRLIQSHLGPPPHSVLDCSCGIGTQAIGLALRGYQVHGTDLSEEAVERAKKEAASFGASVTFGVTDVRALDEEVEGEFDIVLSWGNSLPHIIKDEELRQAARSMYYRLRKGGLLLTGTRDYDKELEERKRFMTPSVFDDPEGKRIVFQVWDWHGEGNTYAVNEFIVREVKGEWNTMHFLSEYRALRREELARFLEEAGFRELSWHVTDESGYKEPVVSARK